MKFCCASNAAIKKCQNRKKKNQLFSKNIFNKIAIFFLKYRFLENISVTSQKYTNENEALMCLLTHTDPTGNPNKKIKMNIISFMTMLYVRIQAIYSYISMYLAEQIAHDINIL